jgi:hypothetical protein
LSGSTGQAGKFPEGDLSIAGFVNAPSVPGEESAEGKTNRRLVVYDECAPRGRGRARAVVLAA